MHCIAVAIFSVLCPVLPTPAIYNASTRYLKSGSRITIFCAVSANKTRPNIYNAAVHTHTHAYSHTGMHARTHAHTHTCTHTHTPAHTHTLLHTHAHMHTHTCMHTHAHTHTHLHTYMCRGNERIYERLKLECKGHRVN